MTINAIPSLITTDTAVGGFGRFSFDIVLKYSDFRVGRVYQPQRSRSRSHSKQAGKQTDRQTDRQDRQTDTYWHYYVGGAAAVGG